MFQKRAWLLASQKAHQKDFTRRIERKVALPLQEAFKTYNPLRTLQLIGDRQLEIGNCNCCGKVRVHSLNGVLKEEQCCNGVTIWREVKIEEN